MRLSHLSILLVVGFAITPTGTHGQSPEAEVESAVVALFDAMRAGDAAAAAELFHPQARLQSVSEQNGVPSLRTDAASGFLEAIGTPRTEVWDERIWDLEVNVDGRLATAWMRYAFYLDDDFSHCGVNAFQLYRDAEGWKVIQISDTRRQGECEEPR
jgi:hypothetical protein